MTKPHNPSYQTIMPYTYLKRKLFLNLLSQVACWIEFQTRIIVRVLETIHDFVRRTACSASGSGHLATSFWACCVPRSQHWSALEALLSPRRRWHRTSCSFWQMTWALVTSGERSCHSTIAELLNPSRK